MLSREDVEAALEYDGSTGRFYWKQRVAADGEDGAKVATWNARYAGKAAGVRTHGYIKISIRNQKYYAHRLAWLLIYGAWPEGIIDHIDCDGENNRISNLRDVTKVENGRNLRQPRKSRTGIPGVYPMRNGRFKSQRKIGQKSVYLGVFDTAEEASEAFRKALD